MITEADKKLLLRVASRLEEHALKTFAAAPSNEVERARRTRDRQLGDVRDVRELIKRESK